MKVSYKMERRNILDILLSAEALCVTHTRHCLLLLALQESLVFEKSLEEPHGVTGSVGTKTKHGSPCLRHFHD